MEREINLTVKLAIFIILSLVITVNVRADSYRTYVNNPVAPGTLPYSGTLFADPNTGAAVYSYPIEVPPGTNGLQPYLALTYNSHNHISYPELTGSGWSLTQNYIQRDTEHTSWDTGDDKFILYLNGESHELVYDSSDGRYHTEIESYMSIRELGGGQGYFNEYWEVRAKDGTFYRFGYNQDSELESNQHSYVYRWYLDLVIDTHGNTITYSYSTNPNSGSIGVMYLDTIQYNNGGERWITFGHEPLPAYWTIFSNGQKILRTRRLSEINIWVNGVRERRYLISYTMNDVGTRSYISSITRVGSDGSTLPPTTFSYTVIEKGWMRDSGLEDKLPDYLEFSYDQVDAGARLIDLNRDGMIDILQNIRWKIIAKEAYLNSYGGGLNIDSSYTPPEDSKFINRFDWTPMDVGVRLGDYNGDGYPDLLRGFYDEDLGEEYYDIWENTGNGWSHSSKEFVTRFSTVLDNSNNYEYVDEGVRLADLNGDGYVDILKAKAGTTKKAWINNNGNWYVDTKWVLPSGVYFIESDGDDEGVRLVDINGDGLVDLYRSDDSGNKDLWLNTGSGWESDSNWPVNKLPDNVDGGNDDEGVRIADVNGDGLADVIRAQSSARESYVSTGEDWMLDSSWNVPSEAEFVMNNGDNEGTRLADIDGDGSVDIIRMKSEQGSVFKLAWKNKASKQFLLDEVKMPSGGKIRIGYINSAETPGNSMGFNQWIVGSVSHVDMEDHHEITDYLDCIPSGCPSGYEYKGIDCSSGTSCTRICEIKDCGSWSSVSNMQNPWSNYDFGEDEKEKPLFQYSGFENGKCYKVETWSDNNVIRNSRIYDENSGDADSAIALSWKMSGFSEQPWGGDCKPDTAGKLIDREYHYLIDDSDSGDDYDGADNLGGTWIGYCIPPSEGCEGYSRCTTECYGNEWLFKITAVPDMADDYVSGNPDHTDGACNAKYGDAPGSGTDYIDFYSDEYVGMKVWKANLVTTDSNNQVCQKTPASTIFYSYSGGLYDFGEKEFRGFNYVEETGPDGSKVKHWFHQNDGRKGKEYRMEIFDHNDKPFQKIEYVWDSEARNGYHVVLLSEMKEYTYDGFV